KQPADGNQKAAQGLVHGIADGDHQHTDPQGAVAEWYQDQVVLQNASYCRVAGQQLGEGLGHQKPEQGHAELPGDDETHGNPDQVADLFDFSRPQKMPHHGRQGHGQGQDNDNGKELKPGAQAPGGNRRRTEPGDQAGGQEGRQRWHELAEHGRCHDATQLLQGRPQGQAAQIQPQPAPLQEPRKDNQAAYGKGGARGPGRSCNSPAEGEDIQGIEGNIQQADAHHGQAR